MSAQDGIHWVSAAPLGLACGEQSHNQATPCYDLGLESMLLCAAVAISKFFYGAGAQEALQMSCLSRTLIPYGGLGN